MTPHPAPQSREVRLHDSRGAQVLEIPPDFALEGNRARIHRDGDRLIIEPLHDNRLLALLDSWKPLDDDFPEIEDAPPEVKDIF